MSARALQGTRCLKRIQRRLAGAVLAVLFLLAILMSVYVFTSYAYAFQGGVLTVSTRRMVLKIEGGAITYVKDRTSGEILVDSDAYANRPSDVKSFVGFLSSDEDSNRYTRWPTSSSSVALSRTGVNRLRLTYGSLDSGGTPSNCRLTLDLTVDPVTGEVILQLSGLETNSALKPVAADLPLMSMTTPGVILGSGARYARLDPEATDQSMFPDLGLYSPTMAVVEGRRVTLAVWSESTRFAPEYIRLEHRPAYDHLILHAGQDPKQANPQRIVSPPWRIGTYPTWASAARCWRQRFEERTGARPLWENRTPWVREVHAVYDATGQDYGADQAGYARLAAIAPSEKVAYLLWNGDRIVLFGDPTLVAEAARPTPEQLSIVERYGWPLILYHPFTLIYSETGAAGRLQELAGRGWLPAGYRFKPDYGGRPEGWPDYWSAVSAPYGGGTSLYVLHPGSSRFKRYLVQNLRDYCALYRADGAYLDILGDDGNYHFPGGRQVVEGQDYVLGESEALATLTREVPQLGVMSEYQSPWVLPFAFYSWESSETHLRQNAHAHTRINHPLRVALIGSYCWAREVNTGQVDDIVAALLGTLPAISLPGDGEVSAERASWSQARARLFCDEELFNDLPDNWDQGVLAYYRGKSGHWFQFKQLGSTYGYVEILPGGEQVVRLVR